MSTKFISICVFFTSLSGMIVLLAMGTAPVRAQCEDLEPSSCASCHAREDPVNEKGEWHIIHASKDICINCHGGNASAIDKDLAHEGLMAHPLDDIYTDCHSCHPDYDARAAQFSPILGVTPNSCATPTSIPVSNVSGGPPSVSVPTSSVSATSSLQLFGMVGAWLSILTLFFFGVRWLGRHHAG